MLKGTVVNCGTLASNKVAFLFYIIILKLLINYNKYIIDKLFNSDNIIYSFSLKTIMYINYYICL